MVGYEYKTALSCTAIVELIRQRDIAMLGVKHCPIVARLVWIIHTPGGNVTLFHISDR